MKGAGSMKCPREKALRKTIRESTKVITIMERNKEPEYFFGMMGLIMRGISSKEFFMAKVCSLILQKITNTKVISHMEKSTAKEYK
jgi:hypothetical protein